MLQRLEAGDLYILCPDDEPHARSTSAASSGPRATSCQNRPPLSRWHADFGEAFAAFAKKQG